MGPDFELGEAFIRTVNEVILQEIARSPDKRGILYIGTKKITGDMPIKKLLSPLGKTNTKIFVVGEGKDPDSGLTNATSIALNDQRLSNVYFTFYLAEDTAYALVCRESWGDAHTCFHTPDPYFTEGLITKFQRDFALQEQL